jgi:signal transduction histidine kinase
VTFDTARLSLARLRLEGGDPLGRALARAMEVSARTLRVARVGIWILDGDELRCLLLYEEGSGHRPGGEVLDLTRHPGYGTAIRGHRALPVADVARSPVTVELVESYTTPLGIGAMLDVPIYRGGELVGVVCHEHVGGARPWTEAEVDFASTVGDMVGALFEQAARATLQAALVEQRRNEDLGRLAAAVAHDFQNVLSSVILHASHLQGPAAADVEAVRAAARGIRDAADEGARLARRLLAFARPSNGRPRRVSLGERVALLEPLLRLLAKGGADLVLECGTEDDVVDADPTLVEQIVVDLVACARDALGARRGTITVRTETPVAGVTLPADRGAVVLEVRCDGPPLPSEALADPFDPLFAVAHEGTGIGLGLAAVRACAAQIGATVRVTSDTEVGTRFSVTFALAGPPAENRGPGASTEPPGPMPGATAAGLPDASLPAARLRHRAPLRWRARPLHGVRSAHAPRAPARCRCRAPRRSDARRATRSVGRGTCR